MGLVYVWQVSGAGEPGKLEGLPVKADVQLQRAQHALSPVVADGELDIAARTAAGAVQRGGAASGGVGGQGRNPEKNQRGEPKGQKTSHVRHSFYKKLWIGRKFHPYRPSIACLKTGRNGEVYFVKYFYVRVCLKNRKRRLFAHKRSSSASKILDRLTCGFFLESDHF